MRVFQVLPDGPPRFCPPLLPRRPLPGLSDQASRHQPGREQTRDAGDMGDAEEGLQGRKPTQRLWEASVFRGERPDASLPSAAPGAGSVPSHGRTPVVGDGGGDLESPQTLELVNRQGERDREWSVSANQTRPTRSLDLSLTVELPFCF